MSIRLDADQQRAADHFEGPALVIAGPGSGKTTVVKERILNLVNEHNVDPEQILAIAFTNAAADEMRERLPNLPSVKICTLHVLGKDLITNHYSEAGFSQKPDDVWDEKKIEEIINRERSRFKIERDRKRVAIYKFEGRTTGRCYIGQTINPERRKWEHKTDPSKSNSELYNELQWGNEKFDFTYDWVRGSEADAEEQRQIDFYRRRAAVRLNNSNEENDGVPITLYKIKSPTTVVCSFGQATDLGSIEKPEGFEVICESQNQDEASRRMEQEMETHRKWAVLNRANPVRGRESIRRQIEFFCEYFNVSYDEVLRHPDRFKSQMEGFDGMKEGIVKEKRKVRNGLFDPDTIEDPILRAFAKRYEEKKKEAGSIDFLDMLIRSADLLENNPHLLEDYRSQYRYVHVDEFQDISPLDFRLIDLFSENLFAVGDDDQAIYGFRGGDSEIMQEHFGSRENVRKYEITRNYRSNSTIVRHSKVLIENNPDRIPKDLRANNSTEGRVEVLEISPREVKGALLNELSSLLETDFREIGILARNWKGEINDIQDILRNCPEVGELGFEFEIEWVKLDDPEEQRRRRMFLRQSTKKVEIINIHTAKGREWEKVILLVNPMYDSLPDPRNDPREERRLFYVAVTRAKQELVVLNRGDHCKFISEFQNIPPPIQTRDRWSREQLDEVVTTYLDRIIFRCGDRLNLVGNIDKLYIIERTTAYLLDLDSTSVEEIVSFAARSIETIDKTRLVDRCVGPEHIHLCTGVFQGFWDWMWQAVEQSRQENHLGSR